MDAWQKRNEPFHDDDRVEGTAYPWEPSEGSSDPPLSHSLFTAVASRFGIRFKTLSTLLYLAGALAMMLFVHD